MLLREYREKIVKYGMKMIESGLTAGTSGNISIYDPETGYMAISPSGIPYEDVKPEDVVIMKLDGTIVDGDRKPSSEHGLHAAVYMEKSEARALIHAHSMFCTTLACSGVDLLPVHYAIADAGVTRIPTIPYETYGTTKLVDAVRKCLTESDSLAFLMANHGMFAYGDSIEKAYGVAMSCEWTAQVLWRSMAIGSPQILSEEQMQEVIDHYRTYGQKKEEGHNSQGYFG